MSKLIVAAVQMNTRDDKEHNLRRAEELIDEACARGARLVALPELFNFAGSPRRQKENAEALDGPTLGRVAAKAREKGIYLLAGSIAESIAEEERYHNTSVLVDPRGSVVAVYRKIHLFDVTLASGTAIRESASVRAGTEVVLAATSFGAVGLTICYDLRFPELYRALTLKGATLIAVPSSFMEATGKDHWEPLLRARAIENGVYLVAPNALGPIPGTSLPRHGRSLIVDPWGTVLARGGDREEAITAELDFDYLARVRQELPSLEHRRPEAYA